MNPVEVTTSIKTVDNENVTNTHLDYRQIELIMPKSLKEIFDFKKAKLVTTTKNNKPYYYVEFKRQTPIYLNINRDYKTVKDRLKHIRILRNSLQEILKNGYSPYVDSAETSLYSAESALDYALSIKKELVSLTTYKGYKVFIDAFKKYLKSKGRLNYSIRKIEKSSVNIFLNQVLKRTTPATRNSYRTALGTIFQALKDNDFIERNFIKGIKK